MPTKDEIEQAELKDLSDSIALAKELCQMMFEDTGIRPGIFRMIHCVVLDARDRKLSERVVKI